MKRSVRFTTAQLELIAELETARLPTEAIAQRLGLEISVYTAWKARLHTARDNEERRIHDKLYGKEF